jgi:hypothetical protein
MSQSTEPHEYSQIADERRLNPAIVDGSHTDIPSDAGGADIFGAIFCPLGLATVAILVL